MTIGAGDELILEVAVGMLQSIVNDAPHLALSQPAWERSIWIEHMMARAIICELLLRKIEQFDPNVSVVLEMVQYCEVELGKLAPVTA